MYIKHWVHLVISIAEVKLFHSGFFLLYNSLFPTGNPGEILVFPVLEKVFKCPGLLNKINNTNY